MNIELSKVYDFINTAFEQVKTDTGDVFKIEGADRLKELLKIKLENYFEIEIDKMQKFFKGGVK